MPSCRCQTQPVPVAAPESPCDLGVAIVAAGSGERFGGKGGKALVPVAGRPLVAWSLLAADAAPSCGQVAVVCRAQDKSALEELVAGLPLVTPVALVAGGATRQESVARGLAALDGGLPLVAVHDGARPLLTPQALELLAARLRQDASLDGVVAGTPSVDTLKVVDENGLVVRTPDRSRYWCVQTPQMFWAGALFEAQERAAQEGFVGTDDASLAERYGMRVAVTEVLRQNGKLTYPEDLPVLEALLRLREEEGLL